MAEDKAKNGKTSEATEAAISALEDQLARVNGLIGRSSRLVADLERDGKDGATGQAKARAALGKLQVMRDALEKKMARLRKGGGGEGGAGGAMGSALAMEMGCLEREISEIELERRRQHRRGDFGGMCR